jgi:glucokinase
MSQSKVLGVDIGGSHLTTALIDVHTKMIVPGSHVRKSVDSHASTEDIIKGWAGALKTSAEAGSVAYPRVGLAMPGPFDYEKGVSYIRNQDKYDALYGLNIKELLAAELNITASDIRMMNDAACFLNGESFAGAAFGYGHSLGITLGTGLGSAWYLDGEITDADLWHSPFNNGIAEDYLSARWFLRRYAELGGSQTNGVKGLAEHAVSDEVARLVFHEFGENLAHFIARTIRGNKPDIVVIGGNIAKAGSLFLSSMEATLADYALKVYVKIAKLGEQAAMYGAAGMWRRDLYSPIQSASN